MASPLNRKREVVRQESPASPFALRRGEQTGKDDVSVSVPSELQELSRKFEELQEASGSLKQGTVRCLSGFMIHTMLSFAFAAGLVFM